MERGTVGIAGLGLIGASVGQGLMSGFASRVIGYDPSGSALVDAKECVHETVSSLSAFHDCELVVVAAPPLAVPGLLRELESVICEGCTVTDVTSVKQSVAEAVPESMLNRFVPGHPMAGHESTGSKYARADLFHGAKWVVCPPGDVDADALDLVLCMVRHLRALPVVLTPEEHDRHVAVLSHLPHVFASALLIESAELSRTDIAGGSWRDLTRVGGSNPELWADILLANRAAVIESLDSSGSILEQYKSAVASGDRDALVALFEKAKEVK